jgi:TolB-like protein
LDDGDDGDTERFIQTVHGRGYRFASVVETVGNGEGPPVDRLSSPPPIRSLAVLPLENLSADPEQEYFADGMTESLIGDLGKIRSLRVISRTSVMQYKNARKPLPQIARELGVDGVIEGTVTREGDRVRITAQLIDGRTDQHLWAERYERPLRSVLDLQGEVAKAVAQQIRLELSPMERSLLQNRESVNQAAHDALLKGLYQLGRLTDESTRAAIASFERAIELDPNYALAHAWLGEAWLRDRALGTLASPEAEAKAKSAAFRALELDDRLPEAHTTLGSLALYLDWDWPASERYLRRALDLNPSTGGAHVVYAFHLVTRGHHDEAIAELRRALELAPLNLLVLSHLANHYLLARRYDDALKAAREVLDIDPTFGPAQGWLAESYRLLGRHEEALAALESTGANTPEHVSSLRRALSRAGAQGYVRQLLRINRDRDPVTCAALHAELGERDQAFAELERAYREHRFRLVFLRVIHSFDPIRDDPRFGDLIRRVGIPES